MSITPTPISLLSKAEQLADAAWNGVTGLFTRSGQDFSVGPEQVLMHTPGIDPHFIPKVPMSNANLDVGLLHKLSSAGYKRAKEVTPETHPELHSVWVQLCKNAGLKRVPQLIFADGKVTNAASLFDENAVVITTKLLALLNMREVAAVLGHELGHEVSDHKTPRLAAALGFGAVGAYAGDRFAQRGGIGSLIRYETMAEGWLKNTLVRVFGDGKTPHGTARTFVNGLVGVYIASILARQLSVHPTELDADRKGARISGDPEALMSALAKLEQNRQKPGVWPAITRNVRFWMSGYPSTENRITRLRQIAQSMPAGTVPAYVAATRSATPQPAFDSDAPGMTINQVAEAERLSAPQAILTNQQAF